ncbi:sulfatase-like hydrolase/transferase [Persicitalea sp.]|uniref:sulfatase-like hydrolase/transferase n=1 Tax=Persicitalea sp. TaxID=3100273 RepID=UPI0035932BA7
MKNKILLSVSIAMAALLSLATSKPNKPNIVLILSDDAGYADFSFQSNRFITTPNIDRIAREGVKFTDAYVTAAVCAPSRAGLLTGINQPEFGNVDNYIKGVKYTIPQADYGIPQNIKLIGDYLHPLGYKNGIIGKWHEGFSKPYHPNSRGFDYFWGFLWGSSQYFPGKAVEVEENGRPVDPASIPYMTDAIGDHALDFIEKEQNNPFFLYVSFNAVHSPLQSKTEDLEKYKEQFSDERKLNNAAMTHSLDHNVGRIYAQLEKLDLLDNTIVIFLNDNGGETKHIRADNYPLRGHKSEPYEGGIRVPMAMRWPAKIKAGTVCHAIVSSLDILPTILTEAGGKLPKKPLLKGENLFEKAAQNADREDDRALYWLISHDEGAIRQGDWKLVFESDKAPQLFNLRKDIGETTDVSKTESKKYRKLLTRYDRWKSTLPPKRFMPLREREGSVD